MPTELKIKWEGGAPGVTDRRLSVGAFGEALNHLLSALRRIATNLVGDAVDDKSVGRFSAAARQLDIEIFDLVKDSTGFDSVVTIKATPGVNFELFNDLPEVATSHLLDAIDAERQGILRHSSVRRYLQSLPSGITRQTYQLHQNGRVVKEYSFGSMDIAAVPEDVPYLVGFHGRIIGVGFEPGKLEVKIKTDSSTVLFSATHKQVEYALKVRDTDVHATAVVNNGSPRLLILREASTPLYRSERNSGVYERWDGLLRRLAQ